MPHALQTPNLNRLLAGLPSADRDYLAAAMRVQHPPRGQVLARHTEPGTDVWFPHDGVVALTATDNEGRNAQTGIVGAEGCIGAEALLDDALPLADAAVQIEGDMSVIPARILRTTLRTRPGIRAAILRYLYGLSGQALQIVACNRLHALDRRCCTWLLMMQDRTGGAELALTQDSLAALLGGGRPRINRTLGALEKSGLLRRKRGRIGLLNRPGLEQRACDCYRSTFRTFGPQGAARNPH
jgi:CRP-like cAMP-binding protein